ncbi:hypothetical protein EPO34_03260 [Patescibacteria group bacterium]|nr:MAG: hypothetical protein EPO34_03260 [Patescibacteria group bacterium]
MTLGDWWNLIRGVPTQAGRPLPEGFVHPYEDAAYVMGGFRTNDSAILVRNGSVLGARWRVGPFSVESYFSDTEPSIALHDRPRMVMWQPLTRLDTPKGWYRPPVQLQSRQHGVVDLGAGGEYWKDWSSHAQRHRRKWLRDEAHEIVEVAFPEYAAAYRASGKLPFMREDFLKIIARRLETQGSNMRLLVAREKVTRRIIAGLAVLDLPDTRQTVHVSAFLHPDAHRTSVGYGLIDAWASQSLASGIRFLFLGLVWYPGDMRGWKGYSKFKRQFAPHLIVYPNALVRLVRRT